MAEDEKAGPSEPGDGEQEQLGPYHLDEGVSQSEGSQGELYRATHEERGSTALVFKPAAQGPEGVPPRDWEVLCVSSAEPAYLAVEVRHTTNARNPEKPGTEELLDTFEQVAAGVGHMARAYDAEGPRVPSRRRPWLRAGVAVGVATGVVLVLLVTLSAPTGDGMAPIPPEPLSCEVPSTVEGLDTLADSLLSPLVRLPGLAGPLPFVPLKGQARPPCVPRAQVEINGGCWMPHEHKPPCPPTLYEHESKCYAPVIIASEEPRAKGD